MIERRIKSAFWKTYFKVYDKNTSLPYLKLLEEGADLLLCGKNKKGWYLDVGCGSGNSTSAIAKRLEPGGKVVGIDNSKEALAIAQKKFPKEYYPSIEFREEDISTPPFKKESFDGILANNSLYLVDPQLSLPGILGLLKPGARFIMSNPIEKENSSSLVIFEEHLKIKKTEYVEIYGETIGKLFLAGHAAKSFISYMMILPFELILKNNVKVDSRFWPAQKWNEEIDKIRDKIPFSFVVSFQFLSYARQNNTFVIDRLA